MALRLWSYNCLSQKLYCYMCLFPFCTSMYPGLLSVIVRLLQVPVLLLLWSLLMVSKRDYFNSCSAFHPLFYRLLSYLTWSAFCAVTRDITKNVILVRSLVCLELMVVSIRINPKLIVNFLDHLWVESWMMIWAYLDHVSFYISYTRHFALFQMLLAQFLFYTLSTSFPYSLNIYVLS